MPTSPVLTRAWLLATLDETGRRLALAADAGVATPALTWTDQDQVQISVRGHGTGVTLEATHPDGRVGPLTFPAGWTTTP
ncbi:hypothetical protein PAI11_37680 [Patulibacter medicamentivorans]|uniref:Uncharacterized protein n=1 Tax=Patulibacter medicamentivorans TaxID=1097667 RepID=H0EA94_9ACTN|nr:hypothetical protein [Patulibacter medicamentivorans]EHN09434.1 hypothetical protein PAI11_37680 [Patulibacter medicamentivorans]